MKQSRMTTETKIVNGMIQVLRGHGIELNLTPQQQADLRFMLTGVLHDSPSFKVVE